MRKFLLLACASILFGVYDNVFAQNKTLGVGVVTPNPNAALHVESPTSNQGFIMPRLTTVQRKAMSSLLKDTDKGLMLFDTDLNTIFIWDGVTWKSSAQVAGGPQLVYPYADTITTSPGPGADLFNLLYTGSATEDVGVAHFENQNANNGKDALSAITNGTGSAGRFIVNNSKSKMPALWAQTNSDSALSAPVYGLNTGTGDVAGAFRIDNTGSPFPALLAESNGTGRTALFRKLGTTGSQPAVYVDSRGGHGIWADHNSTTGYAAIFQTINTGNPNAAMLVESIGTGPSVWALKSTNAVSGDALRAENQLASGTAGSFSILDVNNNSSAINATTAGTGGAGYFNNSNASNTAATLFTQTAGTGAALQAQTSTGFAAIYGRREGATNGNAGLFDVIDPANTYPAVQVNTAGTGAAINARHTGTSGDAVYAEKVTGTGSAGNFRVSDNNNTASAIYGATTAAGGTGVGAANDANGIALAIWNGGIQLTTSVVSVSTSISTRASAYQITLDATVFSLDFGPKDGEVFLIYNETAQTITINDASGTPVTTLLSGEGKTFIVFPAGAIRAF